uniref:Putative secreted protein n=1 Tax=Anopheles darlingi TaxID=43151 RepID=A0A2M4DH67_ANODA
MSHHYITFKVAAAAAAAPLMLNVITFSPKMGMHRPKALRLRRRSDTDLAPTEWSNRSNRCPSTRVQSGEAEPAD